MAYKKKEKISLLLYYDYIDQFEMLNDNQFRQLIYAMIEFDKNEKEPELDNITKMAFVPIKRRLKQDKENWKLTCKTNSDNAKKRWGKEYATVCDGMQTVAKYADIEKEIDIEKEKEIDIERENNNISTPTLSSIVSFGMNLGVDEEYCKKFFNHYEAIGWVNGTGQNIKNWKLVFENWIKKDKKINNEEEYVDEAGFHYKNGRRVL